MGLDGNIYIVKKEVLESRFHDADLMWRLLPNAYLHELDGNQYYHFYFGDTMHEESDVDFREETYWSVPNRWNITKEQLREFVEWIQKNKTADWEVWT